MTAGRADFKPTWSCDPKLFFPAVKKCARLTTVKTCSAARAINVHQHGSGLSLSRNIARDNFAKGGHCQDETRGQALRKGSIMALLRANISGWVTWDCHCPIINHLQGYHYSCDPKVIVVFVKSNLKNLSAKFLSGPVDYPILLALWSHIKFTGCDHDDHDDHDDHGRFIGGRKKSGSVGQRAGRPPASAASSTNV